jgi:hypothetical protein
LIGGLSCFFDWIRLFFGDFWIYIPPRTQRRRPMNN